MTNIKLAFLACMTLCIALTATQKDDYQSLEHWSTGFYRGADHDAIYYYNDEFRSYCQIQNYTQLEIYGALGQVREIGNVEDLLGQGQCLYACPWLDGFYNTCDNSAVYRVYPGKVCLVSTPEMLAAYGATNSVITAEPGSDFTAHRTNIGQCYWPY